MNNTRVIELPWADDVLRVPLPSGWRVLGTFLPRPLEPAGDVEAACAGALAHPIGTAPLAARDLRGQRVLLVVDDVSRPTPVHQFFRPVRDALLRAGAALGDIEILFALGVHRPMTEREAQAKVGADNLARHRWHNHDASDPARLVSLGRTTRGTPVQFNRLLTEFDLLVPLGLIEPHPLLGFGGGAKMLLPGCAGAETIGHNHLQGTTGGRFHYVGAAAEDSPMRLDLEEGVRLLGKEVFLVNAVLSREGRVVRFFCGDPQEAFRAGSEYVRRSASVSVPQPADVVLTNSAPLDADLRQGLKCVGNTLHAARPGGLVLGLLRCANGLGDFRLPSWTLPYGLLRPLLRMVGPERLLGWVQYLRQKDDPIEERFLAHFGLRMLRRNHLWFFSESLDPQVGRKVGLLRQYARVDRMLRAAVRKVGPEATVAVFPLGGASYVREPGDGGVLAGVPLQVAAH